MTRVLTEDFRGPKKPVPVPTKYDELVKKLDSTGFGKISKRTPDTQINRDSIMNALLSGTLSVLGTVSPLAAGIRGFLGLEPKMDAKAAVSNSDDGSTGS